LLVGRRDAKSETAQRKYPETSDADISTTKEMGKSPPHAGLSGISLVSFAAEKTVWWARQDSNLQPRDYESPALTIVLQAHANKRVIQSDDRMLMQRRSQHSAAPANVGAVAN
jgi:hypothetical protein